MTGRFGGTTRFSPTDHRGDLGSGPSLASRADGLGPSHLDIAVMWRRFSVYVALCVLEGIFIWLGTR